jgi:hypothetical protein
MINKVYIVAVSGVETYWIKHICASETTARKRFKELKISMLQDILESIMYEITEYINNDGIYKEYPNEKEEYLKFHMESCNENIKMTSACTFEKATTWIHDKPVCNIYELEE